MPTRPRTTSPPTFGSPQALAGSAPPAVSPDAGTPHNAYRAYVEGMGVTTPYNVNRAQAAIRRIRTVGR